MLGILMQFEYMIFKTIEMFELEYYIAKLLYLIDLLLATLFSPVYIMIDIVGESDPILSNKIWNGWVQILELFLYLPLYFPLKLLLEWEMKLRSS